MSVHLEHEPHRCYQGRSLSPACVTWKVKSPVPGPFWKTLMSSVTSEHKCPRSFIEKWDSAALAASSCLPYPETHDVQLQRSGQRATENNIAVPTCESTEKFPSFSVYFSMVSFKHQGKPLEGAACSENSGRLIFPGRKQHGRLDSSLYRPSADLSSFLHSKNYFSD